MQTTHEQLRKSTDVLAKLMAKENLTIIDGGVETSMIDLVNRVVYVVKFKDTSPLFCKEVRTTCLAHEVGHALFTPPSLMHNTVQEKMPNLFQYVNLVEDIRIEKLIKNQYKGLHSTMLAGRKVMFDNNFYGLTAKLSPAEMDFANKLILYTKVGKINSKVTLTDEEECILRFIERTAKDESSVIHCAKFLYLYCKNKEENNDDKKSPPDSENTSDEEQSEEDEQQITNSQVDELEEDKDDSSFSQKIKELFEEAENLPMTAGEQFKSVDELSEKLMQNEVDSFNPTPITITLDNVSKHIKKITPTFKLKKFKTT